MTQENMRIWNHAGKTEVKFTKKRIDGAKLTSINPTYQSEKATELWGPYGGDWGLDFENIQFIDYTKPATKYSDPVDLKKAIGFYKFYYPEGEWTIAVDWFVHDDDFMIKMETKAISKCLARLGFNNDVFKGQFDDEAYFTERLNISADNAQIEAAKVQMHKNEVDAKKTKIKELQGKIKDKSEKEKASSMISKIYADRALSYEDFDKERCNGMIETLESIISSEEKETPKKELQRKANEVNKNKKKIAEKIIKEGEKK